MGLVTLSDVKSLLNIASDANDDAVTALIEPTSGFVAQYCNSTFMEAVYNGEQYDYKMDGNGLDILFLKNIPVVSIASLTDDGLLVAPANYKVFLTSGIIKLLNGMSFKSKPLSVAVTYTAGYKKVPDGVKHATARLIGLRLKQINRLGMSGETIAGEAVTFDVSDIPAYVKAELDIFKRPWRP